MGHDGSLNAQEQTSIKLTDPTDNPVRIKISRTMNAIQHGNRKYEPFLRLCKHIFRGCATIAKRNVT